MESWADLLAAVRLLADTVDAVEDRTDEYGTFYRVSGMIQGAAGKLSVVCIWMQESVDGAFRFITLKPAKERSGDLATTV